MGNEKKSAPASAKKTAKPKAIRPKATKPNAAVKIVKDGAGAAAEGARKTAEAVATHTKKAVGALKKTGKDAADKVAENAAIAIDLGNKKIRDELDKAYQRKQIHAIKYVTQLRNSNPDFSPSELLDLLTKKLKSAESSSDQDAFMTEITKYVLASCEVYGTKSKNKVSRQKLIDTFIVLDSAVLKNTIKYGGYAAQAILLVLVKKGVKLPTFPKVMSLIAGLLQIADKFGIKNPGKKSVTSLVEAIVKKALGPVPKAWPKPAAKKTK